MNEDFLDKLIDESLKQHSQVLPPADFAQRVKQRLAAAPESARPAWLRWPLLVPVPALAAALAAVFLLSPEAPAPDTRRPLADDRGSVVVRNESPKPVQSSVRKGAIPARPARPALVWRTRFRTLTPSELASLKLPSELLAGKPAVQEMNDLVIEDLKIPDLESESKTE